MFTARARRLVLAALTLVTLALLAPRAEAIPSVLRPGTRPWMFTFALGGGINIIDAPSQFKLEQTIHYHFFGRTEGPALGLYTDESFRSNLFIFQVGPHFTYDIQPMRNLGFLISPFVGLGYSVVAVSDGRFLGGRDNAYHFFNIKFGVQTKLVLGNRGFVTFQPFCFDLFAGDDFFMRFDLLVGGGVTF